MLPITIKCLRKVYTYLLSDVPHSMNKILMVYGMYCRLLVNQQRRN